MTRAPQAIILAAGRGTRMPGDLPKVVHPVAGEPMVRWVVRACHEAGVERCVLVVGYKQQLVRDAVADLPGIAFVEQREQLGTGHAARMAAPRFAGEPCDVFVLTGDGPLIRAATLDRLLATHRRRGAAATLATAVLDNPAGYGRIIRDAAGHFQGIVEQKDATPQQLALAEVNPSYYCFRSDLLFDALARVSNANAQGEYYLTDVPALLLREGHTVAVEAAVPPEDVLSINTPQQLAEVDALLRARLGQTTEVAR